MDGWMDEWMNGLLCLVQEWHLSFTGVQAVHEQTQQTGQTVVSSTARRGQERVVQQLRDLTAQLMSLDDDARRLEASLKSSEKAYQEFDTTASALTAWLTDTESRLEPVSYTHLTLPTILRV